MDNFKDQTNTAKWALSNTKLKLLNGQSQIPN